MFNLPTPFGMARGFGLLGMSLVFEMLASGLAANPIVPSFHSGSKEGRRHRQNGFLLAIDVAAFLPLDEFTATIDETVDAIKALPPAAGTTEISRTPRPSNIGTANRSAATPPQTATILPAVAPALVAAATSLSTAGCKASVRPASSG